MYFLVLRDSKILDLFLLVCITLHYNTGERTRRTCHTVWCRMRGASSLSTTTAWNPMSSMKGSYINNCSNVVYNKKNYNCVSVESGSLLAWSSSFITCSTIPGLRLLPAQVRVSPMKFLSKACSITKTLTLNMPQSSPGISMAVVIGSSMGTLFFLGICLLIAAIVIINVNDYRNWKKYQVGRMCKSFM